MWRGGAPEALGPVAAHEVVVGADAAGGDDDGLRAQLEVADDRRASWPRRARRALGSRTSPATPSTAPPVMSSASTLWRKRSSTRPRRSASRTRRTNGSSRPGPVPHVMWKRGTELPGPVAQVAAALGPAHVGQEAHALRVQPRALLARGEVDVGLGPAARPVVVGPVEAGGAEPVLPGQLARVADARPPLLGAVDEEQAAEGPEGLAAERRLGLLVDEDDAPPGVGELGGGHEAGEAAPDDDDVGVHARSMPHRRGRPRPTPRAWHPAPMAGTEIERKFLADGMPADVALGRRRARCARATSRSTGTPRSACACAATAPRS